MLTVYAAILFAVSVLALVSLSAAPKFELVRTIAWIIAGVTLVLFIGTRDQVGADWNMYQEFFQLIKDGPIWASFAITEPGYAVCNYAISCAGGDIHVVNLICASILVVSLLRYSYLAKVDPTLGLLIATPYLLFVVGMGYTRQSVAIGLGICGIGYLAQGKRRMSYVMCISAFLFHYSAIALLALIWLNSWRRILVLGFIGASLIVPAVHILSQPRYGQYRELQSSGVWLRLAILMVGLGAIFLFRNRWKEQREAYGLLKKTALLLLVLVPLAVSFSTAVDRLCLYLFFFCILGLGRAIRYTDIPFRMVTLILVFAFSYGIFGLWFATSSYAANYWIPYHTILVPGTGSE